MTSRSGSESSPSQDDLVMSDADASMEVEASCDDGLLVHHFQFDSKTAKTGNGKWRQARAGASDPADVDAAADGFNVAPVRKMVVSEDDGPEGRREPKRRRLEAAGRASSDVVVPHASVTGTRASPRQEPDPSRETEARAPLVYPPGRRQQMEASQQPLRIQQCLDVGRTRRMPQVITPSPSFVTCPTPLLASERVGVKSRNNVTICTNKSEHPNSVLRQSSPETPAIGKESKIDMTICTNNYEHTKSVVKQSSPETPAIGKGSTIHQRCFEGDQIQVALDMRQKFFSLTWSLLPLLFVLVVGLALLLSERLSPSGPPTPIEPGSVYLPGAGFSGFWFTLGRLSRVPAPASHSYYCYSAGCLGVVATLSGRSRDEMLELALEAQRLWREGRIGRYDVVPRFVEGLLEFDRTDGYDAGRGVGGRTDGASNATTQDLQIMTDTNLLSKINVITTRKKKGSMSMHHAIRTPRTIHELREMLIHTTWIPYVTGGSLFAEDTRTGDRHMDGGFSAFGHPACAHDLRLPFMMDLFMNTLNVNLGRDKVEKFWDAGVAFGLEIGQLNALHE